MDETPVTNGQFLAFVNDGGYGRRELWTDDDWEWSRAEKLASPAAWTIDNGRRLYRGLFEMLPLDARGGLAGVREPCRGAGLRTMAGLRLPTEPEFHRAAFGDPSGVDRPFPWGAAAPGERHGNFDFRCWSPTPVGAYPEGASAWGIYDLVGNGWEWTETPFVRLPGIRGVDPGLPGVLGRLLRRQALRAQGRIVGDGGGARAPQLSELVPGALPVRLRQVPLRLERLTTVRQRPACAPAADSRRSSTSQSVLARNASMYFGRCAGA